MPWARCRRIFCAIPIRTFMRRRSELAGKRAASFDDLVGASEQGRGNSETESFSCLEVDHQLVLCRRLHRKVGGLLASKDTIDVTCRVTELVDPITPIGDQAAAVDELALEVDCGQFVPGCKCDDQIAMNRRQCTPRYDQTAI